MKATIRLLMDATKYLQTLDVRIEVNQEVTAQAHFFVLIERENQR